MIDLSLMENPSENIYILKKWNWDYLEAEKFQLECIDYIAKNPHIIILIFCSHPHCYTLGRGLQKIKETTKIELIDFDKSKDVAFPLYQIKRGGGLTFHYPGQVVFYPLLNLTVQKKAVFDLMLKIMEITKEELAKQFTLAGLTIKRDLLGLWFENDFASAKIASIGLAVNRYNTYHGLALNFFYDADMFESLKDLHPCGLPGDIYRDIETLSASKLSLEDRDQFVDSFLKSLLDYLITDKQRSSSLINDSISEEVCF